MTTTTLYLVRHGQTEWNRERKLQGHLDSPLTDEGIMQAFKLNERLGTVRFDAVYSSPSPRAVTTARIVSGRHEGGIRLIDDLKEIHMGPWEGHKISVMSEKYPEEMACFTEAPHLYKPVGPGESYWDLLTRAVRATENILSACPGGTALVVTHRMTLKTLLNHYSGNVLEDMGKMPDIPPASLSQIVVEDGHPYVKMYGDTAHDGTLAKI